MIKKRMSIAMYTIAVKFKCFDNKREEYIELLSKEGIIDDIRNEEGCLSYEYYFSQSDKNLILLVEKWDKKESQVKHIDLPHTKRMLGFKGDYVESTEIIEFTMV